MALTANSRLEVLQVYKLLQSVRESNRQQIEKLCSQGIPMLVNYRDPQRGECPLHIAAQSNNESMTSFLLELGAYPNVQDFQGRTPIMRAADYGHVNAVEALLEAGADLKIKDIEGQDVLFYCFSLSTTRHERCLELMMSQGALANNTIDSDRPTLVAACENAKENEATCLKLLQSGADPNAKNKITGRTALAEACAVGSGLVVRALLEKGADPNFRDKKQVSPIHHAAAKGSLEAVKSLAAYGADLTVSDKTNNNALHHAAEGGYGMVCKYLSQRGCNPKQKNTDGFTPRLLAKEKSFKEASKELRKAERAFAKFSKPEAVNPNDPEILRYYDWICEKEAYVKEVLTNSATLPPDQDPDAKNVFVTFQDFNDVMKQISAPITEEIQKRIKEAHEKERKGFMDLEEFLSGKKYISKTHLMSAFEKKKKKGKKGKKRGKGKKGKFKIPIPICIDKDGPRRPDGGPPRKFLEKQLQWIDSSRFDRERPPKHPLQDDSAWYLQQPDKQYVVISDAVKVEDWETLKLAFESGTEIDIRDKYFKTPLMASCSEGNYELTKYLLELGASVEARDNFKWTPLHHACHSGQLDVVQALLYRGADANAVTWNGATPLMRAIESGKPEIVKFLLQCNVNVSVLNKKEKTAVDVAKEWGNAEIYNMVKEKFDAAPKPRKDKKGNLRQPPAPTLSLPVLTKIDVNLLPGIPLTERLEHAQKSDLRPHSAELPSYLGKPVKTLKTKKVDKAQDKKTVVDFSLEHYNRGENEVRENIIFVPRKAWQEKPTIMQLREVKQEKRLRFGEEIDFGNYQKPIIQNVMSKVKEMEAEG